MSTVEWLPDAEFELTRLWLAGLFTTESRRHGEVQNIRKRGIIPSD